MRIPPLDTKKYWTYQDYLQLGEGIYFEIIDGVPYIEGVPYKGVESMTPPAPNFEHQEVSHNLVLLMGSYIQKNHLGKLVSSPIDVILAEGITVQPDIVFISKENSSMIKHRGILGRPDLVIEILSKSSIKYDRYEKMSLYRKFGIPEYWIVDPFAQSIEVLCLEEGNYQIFSFAVEHGNVKSKILDGFDLEISQIMVPQYPE